MPAKLVGLSFAKLLALFPYDSRQLDAAKCGLSPGKFQLVVLLAHVVIKLQLHRASNRRIRPALAVQLVRPSVEQVFHPLWSSHRFNVVDLSVRVKSKVLD